MTTKINNIYLGSIQLEAIIPNNLFGKRTDQALAIMFPDYSRENLKKWILTGMCLINKQPSTPKHKVQGGEIVQIVVKPDCSINPWQPENLPLDLVYEDQDVLVINKPSKLVMQPAAGNWSGTLLNRLLHYIPTLQYLPRAGIVHRLDQDTTGLLVIGKNLKSYNHLSLQLKQRKFIKVYETIVVGQLISGGTLTWPIGRHSHNRLKMTVMPDGKLAITHYRILKKFTHHTHLKITIETGRTHQIRVHMQHLGYPILGDKLYNPHYNYAVNQSINNFPRQALHAKELGFTHPTTNKFICFTSNLPNDMQNILQILNNLSEN